MIRRRKRPEPRAAILQGSRESDVFFPAHAVTHCLGLLARYAGKLIQRGERRIVKILGLLRHAKSDWGQSDKRDFDRGLNERGRKGAELIGRHVRDHGITWDKLVASPAQRVRATLEAARIGVEPEWEQRLYLASTETICDVIREAGDAADTLLLSGHNPGFGDMVFELVAPQNENELFDEAKVKFPTAAFAVFELAIDDWADLEEGCGTLVHFARPRDLDPELGPTHG
jgi:phosphohistidine phosphatase